MEADFEDQATKALAILDEEALALRALDGCDFYQAFQSRDGHDIMIVQKWTSDEVFEKYRSSIAFSRLGQRLKPLMSSPPVTTIATVD